MKRNFLTLNEGGSLYLVGICAATLLQWLITLALKNVNVSFGNLALGSWLAYFVGEAAFFVAVVAVCGVQKCSFARVTRIANKFSPRLLLILPFVAVATVVAFLPLSQMFIKVLGYIGFDGAVQMPDFSSPGVFVLAVVMMCLLPAIGEETFVRGGVLNGLMSRGTWFGICISGVLFALMHGNPLQTVFQFDLGVVLALVFVITGSLWPCIILHFLNNLISVSVTAYIPQINNIDFGNMVFVYGWLIAAAGIVALVFLLYGVYRIAEGKGAKKRLNERTLSGENFEMHLYSVVDEDVRFDGENARDEKKKTSAFARVFEPVKDAFVFFGSLFSKSGWAKMSAYLDEKSGVPKVGKQPASASLALWLALGFGVVEWIAVFVQGCL